MSVLAVRIDGQIRAAEAALHQAEITLIDVVVIIQLSVGARGIILRLPRAGDADLEPPEIVEIDVAVKIEVARCRRPMPQHPAMLTNAQAVRAESCGQFFALRFRVTFKQASLADPLSSHVTVRLTCRRFRRFACLRAEREQLGSHCVAGLGFLARLETLFAAALGVHRTGLFAIHRIEATGRTVFPQLTSPLIAHFRLLAAFETLPQQLVGLHTAPFRTTGRPALLQALGQQGIPLINTGFPLTPVLQTKTNRVSAGMLATPPAGLGATSLGAVRQEFLGLLPARLFIATLLNAAAVNPPGLDVALLLAGWAITIVVAPPRKVVDTSLAFRGFCAGRQTSLHQLVGTVTASRVTRIVSTAFSALLQNEIRDLPTLLFRPAFGDTVVVDTIADGLAVLRTIRRINLAPLHAAIVKLHRPFDALFLRETRGDTGIQQPAGPHVTSLFAGRRLARFKTLGHKHGRLLKAHRFLLTGRQTLLKLRFSLRSTARRAGRRTRITAFGLSPGDRCRAHHTCNEQHRQSTAA